MSSLCRQHMQKVMASLNQDSGLRADLGDYELMLVQLRDDVLRIKSVKSTEKKNQIKAHILPNYLPWIDGVNEAVNAGEQSHYRQDDVFAQVFVWAIDLLDLALVEEMFATIHKANMTLPERFKRAPADFMIEQLAEAVINEHQQLPLAALHRIEALVADIDMHDEVTAKGAKAFGLMYESHDDDIDSLKQATDYFEQALKLDNKAGVKQRMDALNKKINKMTEASA